MKQFENPNIVASLYLLEIEILLEKFLLDIIQKYNNSELCNPILNVYINQKSYTKKHLEKYNISNQHLSSSVFRSRFIYNKIFFEYSDISTESILDLYKILISMEFKIILFFEDHFGSFPYVSIKDFIDTVVSERKDIINNLRTLCS